MNTNHNLAPNEITPDMIAGRSERDKAFFRKPNAVELHPATDAWMSGDRYGSIIARWDDGELLVRLDKSDRVVKIRPENITREFSRV